MAHNSAVFAEWDILQDKKKPSVSLEVPFTSDLCDLGTKESVCFMWFILPKSKFANSLDLVGIMRLLTVNTSDM